MNQNLILEKSYQFALRIVRLFKYLTDEKKEFVLSRKVLDAGTSIGARIKSAQESGSKVIFVSEISVALQRAPETEYWLQLLQDSGYLDAQQFESIHGNCVEIIKMLTAINKSSKLQM
ncbi:MAG TPA: four helix bundle protein [Blastocatellia bacterium]|nr:four helix bundle protein [Blastocatellia bacterium]